MDEATPRDPERLLAVALGAVDDGPVLDRDELVRLAGAPAVLVDAVEREGLLLPHHVEDGRARYTHEDVEALRAGLRLVEAGLPLPELLAIGRLADAATSDVAEAAVDAFHRYVRDPAVADDDGSAGQRLVEAYRVMLPSAVHVVAHQLRRRLLTAALARLQQAAP